MCLYSAKMGCHYFIWFTGMSKISLKNSPTNIGKFVLFIYSQLQQFLKELFSINWPFSSMTKSTWRWRFTNSLVHSGLIGIVSSVRFRVTFNLYQSQPQINEKYSLRRLSKCHSCHWIFIILKTVMRMGIDVDMK